MSSYPTQIPMAMPYIPMTDNNKPASSDNKVMYFILFAAVLGIAGFAYWYFFWNKPSPDSSEESTPSTGGTMKTEKAVACAARMDPSKLADSGYDTMIRGYFDVKGIGCKNDYCRFVGDKATAFLSCAMAGSSNQYTPIGDADVQKLEQKIKSGSFDLASYEPYQASYPDLYKTYTFKRGEGAEGLILETITPANVEKAASRCSQVANCRGFDSKGVLYGLIGKTVSVVDFKNPDASSMLGVYLKK